MKFKSLFILLLAAVWGIASWWWYTCKIKGFCGEQLQSTISNTLPATQDLVADNDEQQEIANDQDQDGIPDEKERQLGLNERSKDSDQDGVNDFIELGNLTTPLDTDDDGIINALDKDDDGDGYLTSEENVDPNGDGDISDARDSNYDGIPDYMDSNSNWGTEDDDGDGITNAEEKTFGTNPALTDSDADGVPDATEINQTPMDTDGDGIIDALDDDDDGDGITTAEENPDPNNDGNIDDALDSDNNGIPDYLQAGAPDNGADAEHKTSDDPKQTTGMNTDTTDTTDIADSTILHTDAAESDSKAGVFKDENIQQSLISTTNSDADEANRLTQEMLALAQQKIEDKAQQDTQIDADTDVSIDMDADTDTSTELSTGNQENIAQNDTDNTDDINEATKQAPVEPDQNKGQDKNEEMMSKVSPAEDDANTVTLAKDTVQNSAAADQQTSGLASAKLYFPFRSSKTTLAASVTEYIDEVKQYLQANPKARIKVTGHTDNVGTARNNKKLGLKRAEMVRDILIDNGVSSTQIIIESQGETQPISDNSTAAGRKLNRRVELKPLPYKE